MLKLSTNYVFNDYFDCNMSDITCTVIHFKEKRYFMPTKTGKVTHNLCDAVDCFIFHIVKFKFKFFTRKFQS
jgi:hypothetical protein